MKGLIKKIAAVILSAVVIFCLPLWVFADNESGIKVSKDKITLEKGQSVDITVYTGGCKTKIKKSNKNVYYTEGKTKNGKYILTVEGKEVGSCTLTVRDKNNSENAVKVKIKITEPKDYTFRTDKLFEDHYKKHGAEFGDITKEEYLKKANELIDDTSKNVLHKRSEDNDKLYFNKKTGEFLVLSSDGYIRTYFIPDDGIKYWERQ